MAVHHYGALAMYSVSLSKMKCGWAARQIRCATHLGRVSFLQIVGLVIPWVGYQIKLGGAPEQGALAGWASQ